MGLRHVAVLAVALRSVGLAAQTVNEIPLTSTIRMTYRPLPGETQVPKPVVGQLVTRRGDSLIVMQEQGYSSAFSLTSLSNLEFSRGQSHPRVWATMLGAVGGGIAGAIYGEVRTSAPGELCLGVGCQNIATADKHRGALQGAAVGIAAGLVGGFIVGSLIHVEQWVSVRF